MPRTTQRTEYWRRQAAESAGAAMGIANVREASLNMEHAWLELAPDIEDSRNGSIGSPPQRSDGTLKVIERTAPLAQKVVGAMADLMGSESSSGNRKQTHVVSAQSRRSESGARKQSPNVHAS